MVLNIHNSHFTHIDTSDIDIYLYIYIYIYAYTVAAKGFKFVMFSEFNTTAAVWLGGYKRDAISTYIYI